MKRARFTEEQIIAVLKEHEAGAKTADLARKHGVSEATIYNWKASSQWLARKIAAMGHTVRIIPAQFVKPYVKSNKSDIIDAAAIAEAVTRPTMRFVEIRSPEHIDLQALHRVRDRMISQRTCLINQMRAFCLEYGIATRLGKRPREGVSSLRPSPYPLTVGYFSDSIRPFMDRS